MFLFCFDFDSTLLNSNSNTAFLEAAKDRRGPSLEEIDAFLMDPEKGLKNSKKLLEVFRSALENGHQMATSSIRYPEIIPIALKKIGLTDDEINKIKILDRGRGQFGVIDRAMKDFGIPLEYRKNVYLIDTSEEECRKANERGYSPILVNDNHKKEYTSFLVSDDNPNYPPYLDVLQEIANNPAVPIQVIDDGIYATFPIKKVKGAEEEIIRPRSQSEELRAEEHKKIFRPINKPKKAPAHEEDRMKPSSLSQELRAKAELIGESMVPEFEQVKPNKAVINPQLPHQAERNGAVIDIIQQSIKELETAGALIDDRMKKKIIEHLSPSLEKLDLDHLKHNGAYISEELTKALDKNKSFSANFSNYTISKAYLAKVGAKLLEQQELLADLRANAKMMNPNNINVVKENKASKGSVRYFV